MSESPLINRVANSGIVVFNLEDHYPQFEIEELDIKQFLFKELILKEKDFRQSLKEFDWDQFNDKIVLLFNSNDAIIPVWAYMLLTTYLKDNCHEIFVGDKESYLSHHYEKLISELDLKVYEEQRVVIKGCSNKPVPVSAYAMMASGLKPYAQSIMYGEPCSTVPIFKRPRKLNK